MDNPIGIFDSGVGGLTVMRAIADRLPKENLLYLGDTARVPYGNRGPDTIRRYALNATRFLVERDIKALVIACNTATAYALPVLAEAYPNIPVIGVVSPVAELSARISKTRSIAVLGTRGTVNSRCYDEALQGYSPDIHVASRACPLLVPLAEENWTSGPIVDGVLESYLAELKDLPIDVLILGCTHYPILREAIEAVAQRLWNHDVAILDSASATAMALEHILESREIARVSKEPRELHFFATDDPRNFATTAVTFFGDELANVEHVDIIDTSRTPVIR